MNGVIQRQPHGSGTAKLSITLPRDEVARLRRESRARGKSVSFLVAELISDARKAHALMQQLIAAERTV